MVSKCSTNVGAISSSFQSQGVYLEGHKELLCEENIASRMCLFAHFQRNIINVIFYQLSSGKGYLKIYIYNIGFYKWSGEISCVVENTFSTFLDIISKSKVLGIMA